MLTSEHAGTRGGGCWRAASFVFVGEREREVIVADAGTGFMHWLGSIWSDIAKTIAGGAALAAVAFIRQIWRFFKNLNQAASKMKDIAPHFDPADPDKHIPTQISKNLALSAETYELSALSNVRLDVMSKWGQELKFEAAPNGDWKQISDTFRSQFGYDFDEMHGQRWISILYRDDRAAFIDDWAWARKDNRLFECNVRFVAKDATIYKVNVSISPEPPTTPKRMYGRVEVVQIDTVSPPDRAKPTDSGIFPRRPA